MISDAGSPSGRSPSPICRCISAARSLLTPSNVTTRASAMRASLSVALNLTSDAAAHDGGRPEPSADLLRQLDDDPLRAADVAEPIAVFVLLHLADELRAAGSHASDDSVDVVDCERDMVRRPQLQRLGCRSAGGNALSETDV